MYLHYHVNLDKTSYMLHVQLRDTNSSVFPQNMHRHSEFGVTFKIYTPSICGYENFQHNLSHFSFELCPVGNLFKSHCYNFGQSVKYQLEIA